MSTTPSSSAKEDSGFFEEKMTELVDQENDDQYYKACAEYYEVDHPAASYSNYDYYGIRNYNYDYAAYYYPNITYSCKTPLEHDLNVHNFKLAAYWGVIEIIWDMEEAGVSLTLENNYALKIAAERGHVDIVEYLLKRSSVVESLKNDDSDVDALTVAIQFSQFGIADIMIALECMIPTAAAHQAAVDKGMLYLASRISEMKVDR